MKKNISLNVNGEARDLCIPPNETLLDTLRTEMFLTGSKQGCDTGGCGCCTVLIDGESRYSCMTYTVTVGERNVTTIEGISEGETLDKLQQAFVDTGAVQCGRGRPCSGVGGHDHVGQTIIEHQSKPE